MGGAQRSSPAAQTSQKAAAKPKSAPTVSDKELFPTLGGPKGKSSAYSGWGTKERERAVATEKAKAQPAKPALPKNFTVEDCAFPDLPIGAPKAKAQKAKSSSKAKAKSAAKQQDD